MPPIRVVADTNTVVSGLLWQGTPRQVLNAARTGKIILFTSAVLLAELEDVLKRPKFNMRLKQARVKPHELVMGYAALALLTIPENIPSVVLADADDDHVIACGLASQAQVIISGDSDLLNLKAYKNIAILTAAELLKQLPD